MLRLVAASLVVLAAGCNLFSTAPRTFDDAGGDAELRDIAIPTTDAASDTNDEVRDSGDPGIDGPDVGDLGGFDMTVLPDLPVVDMASDVGPDAPIDLSDDPCFWPETVFCDGFEGLMLAPWVELESMGATYTRATFPRRTGLASVRFDATANGGTVAIAAPLAIPLAAPQAHWLRVFVNLPSAVGDNFAVVAGLLSEVSDEGVVGAITPTDMTTTLLGGTPSTATSMFAAPRDQWICIEMLVDLDPGGHVQAWAGGNIVIDEPHGGTSMQPLTKAFVGFLGEAGTRGQVDDIILSASRPGCD